MILTSGKDNFWEGNKLYLCPTTKMAIQLFKIRIKKG